MRWPYANIGVVTTRTFRNLLNKIHGDIAADMQEMKTNLDNAVETVSEKAFNKVVDAAKIDWLPPVNTFNDLAITYPDAVEGKTAMCRDSGKVYRMMANGEWQEIQDIDPTAINEVDSRLTSQLAETLKNINGRGINILYPPIPLIGAKGNGEDDSAAIQALIDSVSTNGGGILWVPPGEFCYGSDINIKSNVVLIGAGISSSKLKSLNPDALIKMEDLTNSISKSGLQGINIDGNGKGNLGLKIRYLNYGSFVKDILITGFKNGLDFSNGYYCSFDNVRVRNFSDDATTDDFGVRIHSDEGQVNGVVFSGLQVNGSKGKGMIIEGTHGCTLISPQSEKNALEAFDIQGGGGLNIIDPYCEKSGEGMAEPVTLKVSGSVTKVRGVNIIGGFLVGYAGGYTLFADNAQGINILGTQFEIGDASSNNTRPILHVNSTERTGTIVFSGHIITNSKTRAEGGSNFSDKTLVLQTNNERAYFPNGIGTKQLEFEYSSEYASKARSFYVDSASAKVMYKDHNSIKKEVLMKEPNQPLSISQGIIVPKLNLQFNTFENVDNNSIYEDNYTGKLFFKDNDGKNKEIINKEVDKPLTIAQGIVSPRQTFDFRFAQDIEKNTLFLDASTGKLSFKDANGAVNPLY
jgi:hypothetical protein